jgi:C1A family cysteine protease
MAEKRTLNWRPDLPDHRDLLLQHWKPIFLLPKRIDLRPLCSAVEDQGSLGSCTGNALASALELLDVKRVGQYEDLSRLFIYYQARSYINELYNDSGAYIRDAVKSIRKVGAAKEKLWPYVIDKFDDKPSPEAYADANGRRFKSYWRLNTLSSMLNCLAAGYPFVFGFSVYTKFMSQEVATTGVLDMPIKGEQMEGGHAVLAVGYDKKTQRIIVRNSWGKSWGKEGYFTMPFDYVSDRNLSDDFWTVRG